LLFIVILTLSFKPTTNHRRTLKLQVIRYTMYPFTVDLKKLNKCRLIFMAYMTKKMAVFWVAAPCSLVEVYQRFRDPCCLHHQGTAARTSETLVNFYQTIRRYNREDSHLRTHRCENLESYLYDEEFPKEQQYLTISHFNAKTDRFTYLGCLVRRACFKHTHIDRSSS
jgi:hypothetical protein